MTILLPMPTDRPGPGARTAAARAVALSDRRTAIFFDTSDIAAGHGRRLAALRDGRSFAGPVAVTRLSRQAGGERHVLIVECSAREVCTASISVVADGRPVAGIDPLALQSPLVDPLALMDGLDEAGALRLLRLLLTTGASLFGKGDLGGFGALVGQLVESRTSPVPLSAWCRVARTAAVLSWRLPQATRLPDLRDLCVLHDGHARRFTEFTAIEETLGGERLLHLLLSRPLPEAADLIVLADTPVRLAGPCTAEARGFAGWLERRTAPSRARVLDWLDTLAGGDAQVAALRDELACPAAARPSVTPLHLSAAPDGMPYLIAVDDPRGLLVAARLGVGDRTADLPLDTLHWDARHGTVAVGVAPIRARGVGTATLAPVYRSGRVGTALDVAPTAFDVTDVAAFEGLPAEAAAAPLGGVLAGTMRARPVWRSRVTEVGKLPATPRTAVLLAAGEAPEHLHAAVAAILAQPGGRRVEIVVHHTDGTASGVVRRTAEALAVVHRIGIRIVAMPAEALPSERLRAALATTRAPAIVALGPDTLPDRPRWLTSWRRRIGADAAPRLVLPVTRGCDGSARPSGDTLGLNAAAALRLVSTRPALPGAVRDAAALSDLEVRTARTLGVTDFGRDDGRDLLDRVETAAIAESDDV